MRTFTRSVVMLGLAAFCACAAGQSVTQTGDTVNFTFTAFVTRVPVNLPLARAVGVPGPNLICHGAVPLATGSGLKPAAGAPGNHPADLRAALLSMVYGKTSNDLTRLLAAVQNASSRDAKVRELFGISQLSSTGTPPIYSYAVENAQLQLLQMGQEASPVKIEQGSGAEGLSSNQKCYTTQQIDQAIAEGTRVVAAIVQALQKPAVNQVVNDPSTLKSPASR